MPHHWEQWRQRLSSPEKQPLIFVKQRLPGVDIGERLFAHESRSSKIFSTSLRGEDDPLSSRGSLEAVWRTFLTMAQPVFSSTRVITRRMSHWCHVRLNEGWQQHAARFLFPHMQCQQIPKNVLRFCWSCWATNTGTTPMFHMQSINSSPSDVITTNRTHGLLQQHPTSLEVVDCPSCMCQGRGSSRRRLSRDWGCSCYIYAMIDISIVRSWLNHNRRNDYCKRRVSPVTRMQWVIFQSWERDVHGSISDAFVFQTFTTARISLFRYVFYFE